MPLAVNKTVTFHEEKKNKHQFSLYQESVISYNIQVNVAEIEPRPRVGNILLILVNNN
jgi:hypothetical protein